MSARVSRRAAAELVEAFLAARKPRTVRAYRMDLEGFAAFSAAPDVTDAVRRWLSMSPAGAQAMTLRYQDALLAEVRPATANRRISCIRSLLRMAREELSLVNWDVHPRRLRIVAIRDTRGPGTEAVRSMIAQARQVGGARGYRDVCLLRLLYDLALRRQEAADLDVGDVDLRPDAPAVEIAGKGRAYRERLSLPPRTAAAVAEWIAVRGDEPGPLLVSLSRARSRTRMTGAGIYYAIARLGAAVGAGRVSPHGIRHTAITDAAATGRYNVAQVQQFARHSRPETTLRYFDAASDDRAEVACSLAINA